ncbi:MAG: hypothetical protein RMJ44_06075 [Cytophagales bacterium]|nr:hypothetical protein [Bernardetiaceae bacterium]MDW8210636.1 hypothetical protein [Cytophagales bacterium]
MERKLALLAVGCAVMCSSCFREPNYSIVPEIAYQNIVITPSRFPQTDSIAIFISYRDGDGDLGLSDQDINPPFSVTNPDGTPNRFYYNYFVNIFKKEHGRFVPVVFADPNVTLNARFPRLNNLNSKTAIEGSLRYGFNFFYIFADAYRPRVTRGDTIRFEVQIADRRLHLSNVVRTDEVILGRTR